MFCAGLQKQDSNQSLEEAIEEEQGLGVLYNLKYDEQ
jgi:hypothetical protein